MTKNLSTQKIAILGCGGFIGSHLLDYLLHKRDYRLSGIDRDAKKIEKLLHHPSFSFIKADIHDVETVKRTIKGNDTVISLAALCNPALYNTIPLDVIDINFTQPLELVRMCSDMGKRLIHFSTSEVYGMTVQGLTGEGRNNRPSDFMLSEDTSPLIMGAISKQRWSYATAKQLLERVIYAYGEEEKLEYTIIRPFNFIGPHMDFIPGIDGEGIPRVIACFVDALLFDKPMQLVDGGKNRRTFCAIDDAIDAIVRIIDHPEKTSNEIFNIGNPDNEVTIARLADMMGTIYNELYPQKCIVPKTVTVSAGEFYGKGYEDCDRRMPDISKARELFAWQPDINLDRALRETISSYIEYYRKENAA